MRIQNIKWNGKEWVAFRVFQPMETGEAFKLKRDAIEYAKYELPNFIHVFDKQDNQIYTLERNGYKYKKL